MTSTATTDRPAGRAWTLRAKLVASVLALFAVVMLATGGLTILQIQRFLGTQLQSDLVDASNRIDGPVTNQGTGSPTSTPPRPGRDGDDGPRGLPGTTALLRLGVVDGAVVTDRHGDPINSVVNTSGAQDALDATQIARLLAAHLGTQPRRIDVGGDVGTYLVIARTATTPAGVTTVITGVSTRGVDDTVGRLFLVVGSGTLLGLLLVGAGGTYLVRRNLEPLQRVAATARDVSTLELDRGDVALAHRVPQADTDRRTEVGQVGHALNTLLDNVESALQARQASETRVRQFVADASHELRTPLASIRGYAELTRRETAPVPSGVTHALSRVESEALRMQGLVEDLLLLARLDSGRPLAQETVDLSLLTVNAISDAHAAAPGHQWELDLPDEPIEVRGDSARLHQILANLLANARTHTPEGTIVITSLAREGSWARLAVTDNGPGIPSELQPNVFERFTRGDDSRNRASGSTGLGLSIVAAVAGAHGGRVELTSRPGQTRFSVLLPTL